jgi:hypothetical protein
VHSDSSNEEAFLWIYNFSVRCILALVTRCTIYHADFLFLVVMSETYHNTMSLLYFVIACWAVWRVLILAQNRQTVRWVVDNEK